MGQGTEIEHEILGEQVKYYKISSGKFRRYHDETFTQRILDFNTIILNIRDFLHVLLGIAQSWRLLRKIQPNVVFIKGGFVGLPVGIAAHLRRIPIIIHESDARPGITNKILSRYAHIIATGFPVNNYKSWTGKPVVFTGNPVRKSVLGMNRQEAKQVLKLNPSLKTLLIMGGSSGAAEINKAVEANLGELTKKYQVIHITGKGKSIRGAGTKRYFQYEFVTHELPAMLALSDCIVARAGMNGIAEVAAYKKPLILVPAPQLGDQILNARYLAKTKAAIIVNQEDLSAQLVGVIEQILSSKTTQNNLSHNIASFYRPKAAAELANIIIQSARG